MDKLNITVRDQFVAFVTKQSQQEQFDSRQSFKWCWNALFFVWTFSTLSAKRDIIKTIKKRMD